MWSQGAAGIILFFCLCEHISGQRLPPRDKTGNTLEQHPTTLGEAIKPPYASRKQKLADFTYGILSQFGPARGTMINNSILNRSKKVQTNYNRIPIFRRPSSMHRKVNANYQKEKENGITLEMLPTKYKKISKQQSIVKPIQTFTKETSIIMKSKPTNPKITPSQNIPKQQQIRKLTHSPKPVATPKKAAQKHTANAKPHRNPEQVEMTTVEPTDSMYGGMPDDDYFFYNYFMGDYGGASGQVSREIATKSPKHNAKEKKSNTPKKKTNNEVERCGCMFWCPVGFVYKGMCKSDYSVLYDLPLSNCCLSSSNLHVARRNSHFNRRRHTMLWDD